MGQARRFWLVWLPAFVALQLAASWFVASLEPDGFDRCTASPSPSEVRLQVMTVAATNLVGAAAWMLRRWALVAAAWMTIAVGAMYWVLLRTPSTC